MCELFALSSKVPTRATFSLDEFARHGGQTGPHSDGWGLAFYDGAYAQVYREARPAAFSEWLAFLQSHQFHSQCIISHIRLATQGTPSLRNTQPFSREVGGLRHIFCHNGNLEEINAACSTAPFQPIGETDSEYAFCCLMGAVRELWQGRHPSLDERLQVLKQKFDHLATLGQANCLYSDGEYLYAYADERKQANGQVEPPGLYYLQRQCGRDQQALSLTGVELQKADVSSAAASASSASATEQSLVIFASVPLSDEAWLPLQQHQLVAVRDGRIVAVL